MAGHLLIGPAEKAALSRLRERAEAAPVDGLATIESVKTQKGMAAHVARMQSQSLSLPADFLVFFSVEHGHPGGPARHMSLSAGRPGRLPHPAAVWMVAELLGFVGGMEACDKIWPENVPGRGPAINIIQFFTTAEAAKGKPH